jgi:DNA polymerase-3 subunit alpha (Gram-positive type)
MQLFFFDTETTGLSPENDRIIQFGAIYGLYDKKTDIFHEERRINQYIKTDVPSNEKALAVHQITPEFLEPFFEMEYYIKEFLAYMNKSDVVIGHNLSYDMSMLK